MIPGQHLPGRGQGEHERIRLQHGGASVEGRRSSCVSVRKCGIRTMGHACRRRSLAEWARPVAELFFPSSMDIGNSESVKDYISHDQIMRAYLREL